MLGRFCGGMRWLLNADNADDTDLHDFFYFFNRFISSSIVEICNVHFLHITSPLFAFSLQ